MTENQNKKTMVSLVTSIIAMVISVVISFFLSPYIVEHFGEEVNGFTQLANNFISCVSLITIALNSMLGRFVTLFYYRKAYTICSKYYSTVILGNIFISIFLFFPAVYFVGKLDFLINIETADIIQIKILFAFVFINFFIAQVNSILEIAFYVKNSQYLQNSVNMIQTILNAVGLLIMFCIFEPKIYFVSFLGVAISVLTFPIFIVIKQKILPEVKFHIQYFNIKMVWEMVSAGIWNTVNQCGIILMTGFDLLLCNLFIDPVQMGILSVAKIIPNCIIRLAGAVNTNFSPNLTIAYAKGDKKEITRSLRYAISCSSILVSIPIMVMCIYGESFYALWIPSMDARELTILSFLTCFAFIPFAGTHVLYNVYIATNKLKVNSISVILSGVINFIIVYCLLKNTDLGLLAVAGVSSIISVIRNLMITVPYTARLLGLKWYTFYKDVLLSCVCCLISGFICLISKRIIFPNNWFLLILSVSIACFISISLLMLIYLRIEKKKVSEGVSEWIKIKK